MDSPEIWPKTIALIAVAAIGAFVGATDLVRRYRDAPSRALGTRPAQLYIVVNLVASILALVLIWAFDWTFEREGTVQILVTQVLVAGLSAMILFRSAMFTVRQEGADLPIGPANILQTILDASDRGVDRIRAEDRALLVARIMKDVSFEKASLELPVVALALMQNLSADEQDLLQKQVKALAEDIPSVSSEGKCLALGLLLMTFLGEDVLEEAVNAIKAQVMHGPEVDVVHPQTIDLGANPGGDVLVTVSGQRFESASKLRLNGQEKLTTVFGSTHLTAMLTAADLAGPGEHRVTVFTPRRDSSESSPLRLVVTGTAAPIGPDGPSPPAPGPGEPPAPAPPDP